MAECFYCRKPAGLFRKFHAQCRKRHQNAIAIIPTFFAKILTSPLPAERFSELLREVAKASFISSADLKSLFETGIRTIIDEALKTRLLTSVEEQRISALKTSFGLESGDIPDSEDKLVKVAILRDLSDGVSSKRVQVIGPMPINLQPDEGVLWIFNRVACYRSGSQQISGGTTLDIAAPGSDIKWYIPAQALSKTFTPKKPNLAEGSGDFIVTNFNIYFLSEGQIRKIPLAKINALQSFADGVKILRGVSEETARTFVLDDPWFAINLTLTVARLAASALNAKNVDADQTPQSAPS